MPLVLEVFHRRNSLLLVWCMSYVFAWTHQKRSRIELASSQTHFSFFVKRDQLEKRYGPQQWQYYRWKAKDATIAARKRNFQSIDHGWLTGPSIKTRNCRTDGRLGTASTWTASKPSMCTTLLWPATRKVNTISTFLEVDDFDSGHQVHNFNQIWSGEVNTSG